MSHYTFSQLVAGRADRLSDFGMDDNLILSLSALFGGRTVAECVSTAGKLDIDTCLSAGGANCRDLFTHDAAVRWLKKHMASIASMMDACGWQVTAADYFPGGDYFIESIVNAALECAVSAACRAYMADHR